VVKDKFIQPPPIQVGTLFIEVPSRDRVHILLSIKKMDIMNQSRLKLNVRYNVIDQLTNSKLGLAPAPTSAFLSPPAGAARLYA